ncbi:hypothetical protein JMUB6875_16710 [Nocardia sp. JMUB6875]|uniref:hypothetical protein n=1 Tax=Nocardia sp. JMUB6875 TaxID=3158170 RepID=UPI0032E58FEC
MARSRRSKIPVADKVRVARSVLSGEMSAGAPEQRRLRMENEQLELALAETTVQLRVWQHGAALVDQVPSLTSEC